MLCQINYTLFILALKSDYRKWPFYNTSLYILVSFYSKLLNNRRLFHCKCIVSPLEMVMAKNRATNNRKISIASKEIMWKLLYKIKKLYKCSTLNFHRRVLAVKYYAMLVIVYIWAILESPFAIINCYRNYAVVFSCRMICPTSVTLIFHAKLTLWIC